MPNGKCRSGVATGKLSSVAASEQCVRCGRECAVTDLDFTDGETSSEGEHICERCLTAPEQQAQDRDAMAKAYKDRENRLRRMAEQQGLRLEKARRRDQPATGAGTFHLVNPSAGTPEYGDRNSGHGMSLDEIEAALTS
jgi:hypothetical protein